MTTPTPITPSPAYTPVPIKDPKVSKTRTFTLYYHYRATAPQTLVYEFDGDLKGAIDRGRTHCERMNYRFIKVRPFIVDLEDRERRIENNEDYS